MSRLVVFIKDGNTVLKENTVSTSYSHLRATMGMLPALAETLEIKDIRIYSPNRRANETPIKENSDLYILRKAHPNYSFRFTSKIEKDDFIYSAFFVYWHSKEGFELDLPKLIQAVEQSSGLIYLESDRELLPDFTGVPGLSLTYHAAHDKEFSKWFRKHTRFVITNSYGIHREMLVNSLDIPIIHCQMIDVDPEGEVLPYLPIERTEVYDLVLMKHLTHWDEYIRKIRTACWILSLDNTGMLKRRLAKLNAETHHKIEMQPISQGCYLPKIHQLLSQASLVTSCGRPDFHPARDWSTHKLFEAARAGCLSMVSETNPRRNEILEGLPKELLVGENNPMEQSVICVHQMDIERFQDSVEIFRRNVKRLSRRKYWIPLLAEAKEYI